MSQYYCQLVKLSSNVSPSVKMLLEYASEALVNKELTILDAGCGNGRNAIALSKKFGATIRLLDPDITMIDFACQRFREAGLPQPQIVGKTIEEAIADCSFLNTKFDIVILSYVLQHVSPDCYIRLFDCLKEITNSYLALDVYWNLSYCKIGERKEVGTTSWYGLSREELLRLVAPRFLVLGRRTFVSKSRSAMTFSLLCIPGVTTNELGNLSELDYTSLVKSASLHQRRIGPARVVKRPKIEELPSFLKLQPYFPEQSKIIQKEMNEFLADEPQNSPIRIAARFLRVSREHKFPISIDEISSDFGVESNRMLLEASETGPLERLGPENYLERIVRLLGLDEPTKERAISLLSGLEKVGNNPAVIAASAARLACEESKRQVSTSAIARTVHVSTVSITKRLKESAI
jgi:SAM-dependent methyltransferase